MLLSVFIGVHRWFKALSPVINGEQEIAFSPALTVPHRYRRLIPSSV
jgi:hypothetical protein